MIKRKKQKNGFTIIVVTSVLVILIILGLAMLAVAYGQRLNAIRIKNRTTAMFAAEAGYEDAVFWMSRQNDLGFVLNSSAGKITRNLTFPNSSCSSEISFFSFLGSRPSYKIVSSGSCGNFQKTVEVIVMQQIGGWDMGMCRVPDGLNSTEPVYFISNEVIDMPMHINKLADSPDQRDIYINGSPEFYGFVSMQESRQSRTGSDKYYGVMDTFRAGIAFDQPRNKITDEETVQLKVDRFESLTRSSFILQPSTNVAIANPNPAAQIEFFIDSGIGKVRITNNCAVRGFRQNSPDRTWDYKVRPKTNGQSYDMYDIYSYHYVPQNAQSTGQQTLHNITDTYVTQNISGVDSEPGGQIFVDGNVVIGGDNGNQVVKGKITIVATGNIWIADSIFVEGDRDSDGSPSKDNPNALGLIAQGVIRVVDPGLSDIDGDPEDHAPQGYIYQPVARRDPQSWFYTPPEYQRHLPDPMVVEAAITVGGGGFGAENVQRGYYGGRKETGYGSQDRLLLRGTLTETLRGVVGLVGRDGYLKNYYFDERLLSGILPGDMWLRSKYTTAPAGWKDY